MTSKTLSDRQTEFVARYLGVRIAEGTDGVAAAATAAETATEIWRDAKDSVDDALRALSDRLRKTGVPQVQAVADDVETLLQPLRVKLPVTLMEVDKTPNKPEARKAALKVVSEARAWLESDRRVAAIDTNPWKIPVDVAATLGASLDRLEDRLSAAGAET